MVCRTIPGKLDFSFDVALPSSLPRSPKPTTRHKLCWPTGDKWLALVKRGRLVIGQSHSHCRGLFGGQRCALPRTLAADKNDR